MPLTIEETLMQARAVRECSAILSELPAACREQTFKRLNEKFNEPEPQVVNNQNKRKKK